MRFTISPATASFSPVSVNIIADNPAELALITNLFGGVPSEATSPTIDELANALRTACDTSGVVTKAFRKGTAGFNWGKVIRELSAD